MLAAEPADETSSGNGIETEIEDTSSKIYSKIRNKESPTK